MTDPTALPAQPPPQATSKRRARRVVLQWLRISYFTLASAVLLLLAIEIGMRVVASFRAPDPDGPPRGPEDVTYTLHPFLQTAMPPNSLTRPGPYLAGWQVYPARKANAPDRKRIMFLGGSTTATAYPFKVQEQLSREFESTIFILAWDNHCTLHTLFKFWTYFDEVKPDIVVVLDVVNDFFRGFTSPDFALPQYRSDYSNFMGQLFPFWTAGRARLDGRLAFYSKPSGRFPLYDEHDDSLAGLARSIASDSLLLRSLGVRLAPARIPLRPQGESAEMETLRSLPSFERNLHNLALSCSSKGVKVLFLTMPFTLQKKHNFLPPGNFFTNDGIHHLPEAEFVRGMQAFNGVVLGLRDEPRAYVLDLAAEITDPELFRDEVHLLPDGLAREAELVSNFVLERRLLQ